MIDSPSEKNQIQLLIGMLRRHWLLVVSAGICGGGLAYALGSMLPQRYTAYAQIALDPDVRVTANDVESKGEVSEAEIETHVTIIGANDHMRRVHADLVRNPPAHAAAQRDPHTIPEPDELRYWMKAYQERKSRVITVTYTHDRPELAAALANRIADLYVRADGERKINLKIKAYAAQQLDALGRMLKLARSELEKRDVAIARLKDLDKRTLDAQSLDMALEGVPSNLHGGEIARIKAQLQEGLRAPNAAKPAGEATGSVDGLRRYLLARLVSERDMTATRVRSLEQSSIRFTNLRGRTTGDNQNQAIMDLARMSPSAAESIADEFGVSVSQMTAEAATPLRMLSQAAPPEFPASINPLLLIFPGALVFALAGGMFAIVRETADTRLRTPDQISAALGARTLGSVPIPHRTTLADALQSLQLAPQSPYAEAIRHVSVAIMRPAANHRPAVILVTSVEPTPGKPLIATGIAAYLAGLRERTLMIDLAFRDPRQSMELAPAPHHDIIDVLQGTDVDGAIQKVEGAPFEIIPIRVGTSDPMSSLLQGQLSKLIDALRSRYDRIVIEASALKHGAEVGLLAPAADKILVVLEAGKTSDDLAASLVRPLAPADVTGAATTNKTIDVVLTTRTSSALRA